MAERQTSSVFAPIPELAPERARKPSGKKRRAPPADVGYPRRGEPIVPRLVVPLLRAPADGGGAGAGALTLGGRTLASLRAHQWDDLSPEESRHLGMLVVERVQGAIRAAPSALLRRALPSPVAVVDRLTLERRTANLLRRWIASSPAGGPWTLNRYLSIPGFGARALVDLLAALERKSAAALGGTLRAVATPAEARATPRAAAAPTDATIVRAMKVIAPRLPLSETDASAALVRDAGLAQPMPLAELARAAARLRLDPTFHVVEIGGTRVAVAQPDVTAARNAYAIASRAVYNWGAATIRGVTEQLAVMTAGARGPDFVERLLTAIAGFEWLDREGGWFWFVGRPNRLLADLAKVLAVVARLSGARLWAALCRARTGPEQPPPAVLPRLCASLPGVRVLGDVIEVRQPLPTAAELSHAESRLVSIFRRGGRPLAAAEVRAMGHAAGLSWKTVRRMLVASPLVERLSGPRYALIGSAA